jgi:hypothetical protein
MSISNPRGAWGISRGAWPRRARIAASISVKLAKLVPGRERISNRFDYGEREWTMKRIAKAPNVAQSTITEDLRGLSTVDKLSRPREAGSREAGLRFPVRNQL